jgi:hypothetical protein
MNLQRGSQAIRIVLLVAIPLLLLAGIALFISYGTNEVAPIHTSKWKTYQIPTYEVSFTHPPEWEIKEEQPVNQDTEASYKITDPLSATAFGTPLLLAQIDISTRTYPQILDRIKSDTHATTGETIQLEGIQGMRFRSDPRISEQTMEATVLPLGERTIIIYIWPGDQGAVYQKSLELMHDSFNL